MQPQFIVYKSSAGSGKTFTLVKEYLKLALADKNNLTKIYKSILAITFTNKAASEMKWRIIKALKEISSESNPTITELIAKELNIDHLELKSRAEIVLTDILHHYSDFSISTIDSFTHRIIRTFALDLQLPINFQIETDADTVYKKIVGTLINNLGKDELITDYLVKFSLSQIENNKNWDPEKTLIEFIKEIHKEGSSQLLEKLGHLEITDFNHITSQISTVVTEYEKTLKQKGDAALSLIQSKQLTAAPFASGGLGIYNFFIKLSKFKDIKDKSRDDLFGSNVTKTLREDKWTSAKATTEEKNAIHSIKNELETIATFVSDYMEKNEQRYTVFKLVNKNMHAIGLVNELTKMTNEYKEDENILFISEFNERIAEIVNNEPTPFIFERLGDKYSHFLLDEFQDTSAMQWQNTLPLIDHSLANGNLNLIVGDGKQSIYRWRNADVQQFIDLPNVNNPAQNELLHEREQSLVRNFKEEFLIKNYRSQPIIVDFNNQLFDHLSQQVLNDYFKKIYHQQKQEYTVSEKGFVSLDFPLLIEDDTDQTNLAFILKYIQQAQADDYNYNDICIIVRKNKQGNTIANFLIEKGIPVVSADSLLLNSAKEVNVILSFLRYTVNQKDLVSASVVINHLKDCGFCNEEHYVAFLRELNVYKTKNLFSILNECNVKIDVAKLNASNLFDCCLQFIYVLQLNKANSQYVRFFLDEVLSFLQSNTSNTSLFLEWWNKRIEKASVIIPEGINAIRIMTIHASKGLEFPIVITPYLTWDVEKSAPIWIDINEEDLDLPVAIINTTSELETTDYKPLVEKERQQQTLDSLNILYVDFTRAVERLHIISPIPKKKNKKNTHNWLYEFAKTKSDFNEEKQVLYFGKLNSKDASKKNPEKENQLEIKPLDFTQDHDVIKIKEASLYESNEEVASARDYGVLVHHILSKINTREDLDVALSDSILSGEITNEEAKKIDTDIKKLLDIKTVSPYFEKGIQIKNEPEILTDIGTILRPDRVVLFDKEAVVIDYKTGKRNIDKHASQMQDYEDALIKLGYKSVKKILLYIHEQQVEILH